MFASVYLKKKKVLRWYYTSKAKRILKSYGVNLRVNKPCVFTKNTVVGDCCNFNGMIIQGGG